MKVRELRQLVGSRRQAHELQQKMIRERQQKKAAIERKRAEEERKAREERERIEKEAEIKRKQEARLEKIKREQQEAKKKVAMESIMVSEGKEHIHHVQMYFGSFMISVITLCDRILDPVSMRD